MVEKIAVLDLGSTRIKTFLYDREGNLLKWRYRDLSTHYPKPGWVEQDPVEIWEKSLEVLRETLLDTDLREVFALAITNQRSTSLIWDRETGRPLSAAITWQDGRTRHFSRLVNQKAQIPVIQGTAQIVVRMMEALGVPRGIGLVETLRTLTHFSFHPALSAIHLAWNLRQLTPPRAPSEVCFGTIDSWVLWNLTGGQVHGTDVTNASVTGLFQIFENRWNGLFLKLLKIPPEVLPPIFPSAHHYGTTIPSLLGSEIPITGVVADQQASMVSLGCLKRGTIKCTMGTGSFVDLCLGKQVLGSASGVLPLVALGTREQNLYLLEGMINGGGNLIDWAVRMGFAPSAKATSAMALSVSDNGGLYMVPAFSGLYSPYWDTGAKAVMVGFRKSSHQSHMVRSVLESIGYQVRDVLLALKRESKLQPREIWVDGGVGENDFVLQWIANMSGLPVIRPKNLMATSQGAAYIAGLGRGLWKNLEDLPSPQKSKTFSPELSEGEREKFYKPWKDAVYSSKK